MPGHRSDAPDGEVSNQNTAHRHAHFASDYDDKAQSHPNDLEWESDVADASEGARSLESLDSSVRDELYNEVKPIPQPSLRRSGTLPVEAKHVRPRDMTSNEGLSENLCRALLSSGYLGQHRAGL